MQCDNCELEYDPVRFRWRCPHCGWKANCCEGEPARARRSMLGFVRQLLYALLLFDAVIVPNDSQRDERGRLEYADCAACGETVQRYPGAAWQHYDARDDADHEPQVNPPPLTEREAEQQLLVTPDYEEATRHQGRKIHPVMAYDGYL